MIIRILRGLRVLRSEKSAAPLVEALPRRVVRVQTLRLSRAGLLCALLFCITAPVWPGQADDPLKAALDLHDSGKVKEAIQEYDKVIKAQPKLAEAYFNRGNAYYDLEQYQQAIKDYSQAIRLNPKDAEAYYNRGNAYRRLKQDPAALNDYSAAIKINPDDTRSYINRGSIHFDARRYE
jgi:tetratricopeptide (TPR) repeat protein